MKTWRNIFIAVAALTVIGTTQSYALDMKLSQAEPEGYENLWDRMSRKLGRGISNAAFGALELPVRIVEVNFNEGGIAALTAGVFSGLGYFIAREFVGVAEIITFPFPLPGCPNDPLGYGAGYGPILTPEWVITPETNYYNFVYTKGSYIQ